MSPIVLATLYTVYSGRTAPSGGATVAVGSLAITINGITLTIGA